MIWLYGRRRRSPHHVIRQDPDPRCVEGSGNGDWHRLVAKEWEWDETLYVGSAPHYAVGRMSYPPSLADAIRKEPGLDGRGRLLDVGRGAHAADTLAGFLQALHMEAPAEAPVAADRGAHPRNCTDGFENFLPTVAPTDIADVRGVRDDAVAAQAWEGPPVWVHGDLHPANVVVSDGTLSGIACCAPGRQVRWAWSEPPLPCGGGRISGRRRAAGHPPPTRTSR